MRCHKVISPRPDDKSCPGGESHKVRGSLVDLIQTGPRQMYPPP